MSRMPVEKKRVAGKGRGRTQPRARNRLPGQAATDFSRPVPASFTRKIDASVEEALRRIPALAGSDYPLNDLWETTNAFMNGGKRIRPVFFLLSYTSYGGSLGGAAWRMAAGIELLHAFALMHDDILDESASRRSRSSIHVEMGRRFGTEGDSVALGRNLGILAGDVLFALAVERLLSANAPADRIIRVTRLILDAAVQTGCGVFREIVARTRQVPLSRNALLKLYDAKTGIYSFVLPMQAGALLAGAPERELAALSELGLQLGRAYQIQDDLQDLEAILRGAQTGSPDTLETFLLFPVQTAMRSLPVREQTLLTRICGTDARTVADVFELKSFIRKTGAMEDALDQIDLAIEKARHAASRLAMPRHCAEGIVKYCRTLTGMGVDRRKNGVQGHFTISANREETWNRKTA